MSEEGKRGRASGDGNAEGGRMRESSFCLQPLKFIALTSYPRPLELQFISSKRACVVNDSQRSAGFNPLSHVARAAIHLESGTTRSCSTPEAYSTALLCMRAPVCKNSSLPATSTSLPSPTVQSTAVLANLTTLDLQTRNINRPCKMVVRNGVLFNILGQCCNLVSLKAFAAGTLIPLQAQAQGSIDPVVNRKLRHVSLALLNLSQLSTVELLAYCDWPSLTSLHLASLGENDRLEERSYVLEKLATKYGRVLTSLRFSFRSLPPGHLREVLSLLPNLIQLHIDDGTTRGWYATAYGHSNDEADSDDDDDDKSEEEGRDDVLESLTPKECSTAAQYSCHFLQYLRWEGHTPFSDGAVKKLLFARASPSPSSIRMKQLVIHFDRCMQEDIRGACAPLVEDGLKLQLSYRTPGDSKEADIPNEYRDLYIREDSLAFGWE
ncbi:hypothetical protein NMY22_g12137 [Coprinellus aureogranulatus]|nr:hypothetical protein NMY22_g12137 [Coprinellus aureogranulatus]